MINKVSIIVLFIIIGLNLHNNILFAQESLLFQGKINSNNINVRSDSTVSSEIICKVNKGNLVEVILELYDWCKIRLPKNAPSFVKKNLVRLIDVKKAKALKDNINIRLHPNESSPILGRVNKDEVMNVLEERRGWYKIEPINNSSGWIHKKFVNKYIARETLTQDKPAIINKIEYTKLLKEEEKKDTEKHIALEGVILPYGKVFKRKATHKLITKDNEIYLLKGNKEILDILNYHKVKILGKLINAHKQKHPIIEIIKMEMCD